MNTIILAPLAIGIGIFAGLAPIGGYMQQQREQQQAYCSPNVGQTQLLNHLDALLLNSASQQYGRIQQRYAHNPL